MLATNMQAADIEHEWREWVEMIVPRASKLPKEFRERGWVRVGLQDGWNGVKAVFQVRGAIPTAKALQDLRRETEDALAKLKPLYERIETTDRLIDQIVYQLYGLTEEEISVIEESMKGA
jgi:hypothetical protein